VARRLDFVTDKLCSKRIARRFGCTHQHDSALFQAALDNGELSFMGELLDKFDIICIRAMAGRQFFVRQMFAYSASPSDSGIGSLSPQHKSDADDFIFLDCARGF
jgi:hypothetical protein